MRSAIDELGPATGRDPVELRRELLADSPRTLAALDRVAEAAGWGTELPAGSARGIACFNGFASHSAQATEISLDDRERVHIDRMVVATAASRSTPT